MVLTLDETVKKIYLINLVLKAVVSSWKNHVGLTECQ